MEIKLPNLGEGAESGVVVNIMVKEGDTVEPGQPLIEVETGKAIASIPAEKGGTITKILVKIGDRVIPGKPIMIITTGTEPEVHTKPTTIAVEQKPATASKPAQKAPAQETLETAKEDEPEISEKLDFIPLAPPSIRKLARELGLDLRNIKGTGPGGRILMEDLRTYILKLQKIASEAGKPAPVQEAPPGASIDFSQWGPITKRPMSQLRLTIARRMVESSTTIPQVTQFDDADITNLEQLRKKFAPVYEAKGARLTLTVFALKAVVSALRKHPYFNASIDELTNEIILKAYYHIGIAVDTEAGLLVPVIRNVEHKNFFELALDLVTITNKAKERKLTIDDMRGGTFTISNQGGIGGGHFTPIINKPEVAILGIGRGKVKPVYVDGKIEPRLMLPLAVSYDHRLIDGAQAARFITDLCAEFASFSENDLKLS